VDAAAKAGRRRLGYVVEHGEELVSHKAQPLAEALAELGGGAAAETAEEARQANAPAVAGWPARRL
jgi:hypothetical protein